MFNYFRGLDSYGNPPRKPFPQDFYNRHYNATSTMPGKRAFYEHKNAHGTEAVAGNAPYTPIRARSAPTFSRRGRARGKAKRKRTPYVKDIKQLKTKVARLQVGVQAATGVLTHRFQHVRGMSTLVSKGGTAQFVLSDKAQLAAVLGKMPYYDSSTNSMVEVSPATQTFQSGIEIKSTSISVKITNNQQVSVHIRVALMTPTGDTNIGPNACFNAGLLVQGKPLSSVNTTLDNPLVRWSDSQQLTDMWKNIPGTYKDVMLSPGAFYEAKAQLPCYNYEARTTATDNLNYRVADRACVMLVQAVGNVRQSQDVPATMDFGPSVLQIEALVIRKVVYAAGADVRCAQFLNNETVAAAQLYQCNQPNTETRTA